MRRHRDLYLKKDLGGSKSPRRKSCKGVPRKWPRNSDDVAEHVVCGCLVDEGTFNGDRVDVTNFQEVLSELHGATNRNKQLAWHLPAHFSSEATPPTAMASVLVPVLYVVIVFGSLYIFSYLYRRHNASKCPCLLQNRVIKPFL
jgi:hypothetical protein